MTSECMGSAVIEYSILLTGVWLSECTRFAMGVKADPAPFPMFRWFRTRELRISETRSVLFTTPHSLLYLPGLSNSSSALGVDMLPLRESSSAISWIDDMSGFNGLILSDDTESRDSRQW